jgi:Gpi16 subunit, GPI transamidase component
MKSIAALSLVLTLAYASQNEAYRESLDLFQLPKGYYLNRYTFQFEMKDVSKQRVDKMPLQMVQFARGTPEVKEVEMDLVQGRWQEGVMKAVSGYGD